MKKIIICEGKDDTKFLTSVLCKLGYRESEIKPFDQSDIVMDKKHRKETEILNSFYQNSCPRSVLVKSEGGRGTVIGLLSHVIGELKKHKVIVFIDRDEDGLDSIIGTISEKIKSRRQSDLVHTPIHECGTLSVSEMAVHKKSLHVGNFHLITLKPDLDRIVGIDKEADSREVKESKIERFVAENDIHTDLSILSP